VKSPLDCLLSPASACLLHLQLSLLGLVGHSPIAHGRIAPVTKSRFGRGTDPSIVGNFFASDSHSAGILALTSCEQSKRREPNKPSRWGGEGLLSMTDTTETFDWKFWANSAGKNYRRRPARQTYSCVFAVCRFSGASASRAAKLAGCTHFTDWILRGGLSYQFH
jgi:hypothetical protein